MALSKAFAPSVAYLIAQAVFLWRHQIVLSEVIRWVGVATALVGTVVVAPEGTRELLRSSASWLNRHGKVVRGKIARWLPFP